MNFFWSLILLAFLGQTKGYCQKIKVACIGNSVTAGYLLAQPEKQAYPAQLQQLLGDGYQIGNFGHSGATLLKKGHNPYFKTKEFLEALSFGADIAIIHLGLNDTDPRNWPNYKDQFQSDYQWLIDTLKQQNPKLKVYICKLTPIFSGHPRFKSGTGDWYWQVQEKILSVAKFNKVVPVDLNTPLHNRPELFADNLHPDSTGAAIIAKTIYRAITGNFGGFQPDRMFSSNMVLQRDKNIPVYGTANTGEKITVSFNGQTRRTVTGSDGKWKVIFPPMWYGGPYQMKISGPDSILVLKNILIGDVWLCSGQSNMAFPLKSSATGAATLQHLNTKIPLRLLKFKPLAETDNTAWDKTTLDQLNQLNYFSGTWQNLSDDAAADFSAVAYYFGEKLAMDKNIPIGLIELAVGGSPLESWLDRRTMEQDNLLVDILDNWRKSDFLQDWVRERADVNLKNSVNPKQRHPYAPAYNYEAGVAVLTAFPIKGVIWYQGESNAHNVELFSHEFPLLVKSWRAKWNDNFPFYYVQLSGIDRPSWPYFRDTQRKLQAAIPNSGMAVSSDLGDSLNVHPIHKKEIGERLALLALKNTYHKNITARGPVATKAAKVKNIIVINFTSAKKLKITGSGRLTGFELEDITGVHFPAKASIVKNEVHLNIPPGRTINRVLYAWQPFTRGNLINEAGLPASTFSISIP